MVVCRNIYSRIVPWQSYIYLLTSDFLFAIPRSGCVLSRFNKASLNISEMQKHLIEVQERSLEDRVVV